MRKNILSSIVLLAGLLYLSPLYAFSPDADIKVNRERNFVGSALYGFMNGGSVLYLEYGFRDLKALEIVYKGEDFTVEVYRMPSPENAYGIYSQHSYKCVTADSARLYDCASNYELQAAIKDLYITVVFAGKSSKTKQSAYELIDHYSSLYALGEELKLPSELGLSGNMASNENIKAPLQIPLSGRLKYMVGEVSASNLKPAMMPLLEQIQNYKIWMLKGVGDGKDPNDKRDRILIFFGTSEDRDLVKKRITTGEVEGLNSTMSEEDKYLIFCL